MTEICTVAATATLDSAGGAAVALTVGQMRVLLSLESVMFMIDRLDTCLVQAIDMHKVAHDPDTAALFWAQHQGVA